jgi:hypothetical protein
VLVSLALRIESAEIGGGDHGHRLGAPAGCGAFRLRRLLVRLLRLVRVRCLHHLQDGCAALRRIPDQVVFAASPLLVAVASVTTIRLPDDVGCDLNSVGAHALERTAGFID